ncbi:MAG: response regulator [Desulfotignum sp.]|nr:response regulator [Desulfotignum sp.]MCF8139189.1 response regulator [Desulfotignum sp.]
MNILIVDDHEANLYLLESLLNGNGHQVMSAPDGKQALDIVQTGDIDLIITDILMPVMDGFQLCRKIKNDPDLAAIPLIFYTATYTGPQDEAFAFKIGADRFIVKPCEPDVLITAVNEVLASAQKKQGKVSGPALEEEEAYKLYSERLVTKLEQKMLEAEQEIEARKKAETDLRKSQAQLIQARKMESVGRLAGGMAHDYNNMINVIMGFAELALGKISPKDPLYGDIQEIIRAARRTSDMTRKLLTFARRQKFSPHVLDLNETIEGMRKMLDQVTGKDIQLAWHPKPGLWDIFMDPSQIDQVLLNLCVNAKDAVDPAGRVVVETDNTHLDAQFCSLHPGFSPGDFVTLTVTDDGCGMDAQTRERIFEPFYTTKAPEKGTGLGLATVYGIVKQNHGFIQVTSAPQQGTRFILYLPRHIKTAAMSD